MASGFLEVWTGLDIQLPLAEVAGWARRVEAIGFDGLTVPDVVHDGFLVAAAALGATSRLRVRPSGIIAFARSPMIVAVATADLRASHGTRFELGLGPLLRSIVVDRYSMPWSPPAPRMREYVQALRAIFSCWQDGVPLRFEGEHYRFTRMQDYLKPPRLEHPDVPIHLAGIGPAMTALAGELAAGLATHPTNSAPVFLREVTLPNLARGAARTGRTRADLVVHANPFVATGPDPATVARERESARGFLAMLLSTPQYWRTLDRIGRAERGRALHALVREGRMGELAAQIDDPLLDALVPSATWDELPDLLRAWYGGLADAVSIPVPADRAHDDRVAAVVERLRI